MASLSLIRSLVTELHDCLDDMWQGQQVRRRPDGPDPANWRLALALVFTIGGMIAGLIADLIDLPLPVLACALTLFLGGAVVVSVLAFQDAREGHVSILRAISRALKVALGWVLFLP